MKYNQIESFFSMNSKNKIGMQENYKGVIEFSL